MADRKNVEELTYKEASTELELIIRSLESVIWSSRNHSRATRAAWSFSRASAVVWQRPSKKVSVLLQDVDGTDQLVPGEPADDADSLNL